MPNKPRPQSGAKGRNKVAQHVAGSAQTQQGFVAFCLPAVTRQVTEVPALEDMHDVAHEWLGIFWYVLKVRITWGD
jgi:hypothetical protein